MVFTLRFCIHLWRHLFSSISCRSLQHVHFNAACFCVTRFCQTGMGDFRNRAEIRMTKHEFPEGSHLSSTVDLAGLPSFCVFLCSFFLLLFLLWCLEGQISDSRRSRVPNETSNISSWISPPSSSDVTSAAVTRHGEKWFSLILVWCILSRGHACEHYPCLDLFLLGLHVWQFSSRPS